MDLVGPLPESQGKRYLLTICERLTRWLKAIPLTSINANTVTNAFLSHWVCRFGIPSDIVSDRGLQFTSRTFTSSLEAIGSNGMVGRTNRRLKEALAAQGGEWTHNLPWVLLGLRNTPQEDNDLSPPQIM